MHQSYEEILAVAINKQYIELENTDNLPIINKLITTLLYKSNRHGWGSEVCVEIRSLIEILHPYTFNNGSKAFYECYIANQETQNNTFYGSYLSSDSGEEENFNQSSPYQQREIYNNVDVYMARGQ